MAIKRSREDQHTDFESSIAMANYLILLSTGPGLGLDPGSTAQTSGRVFECKTCSRRFPSFQALGGHRASHKKPRPGDGPELTMVMGHDDNNQAAHNGGKPKAHECSICGQEFAIGQALGGHMRRHRADLTGSQHLPLSLRTSHEARGNKGRRNGIKDDHDHKRVKCLDLNLTPLENGLMEFGTVAPIFC